jgi:hypothetical protein
VAADIARYTFLTEGIEAALAQARAAAGAKDVLVVGGANVARASIWRPACSTSSSFTWCPSCSATACVSSRAIGDVTLKPTRGVSMGFVTAW